MTNCVSSSEKPPAGRRTRGNFRGTFPGAALDRQRHALFSAGAGDTLSVSYRTRTKVRQVFGCATILVRVVPSCRIVRKGDLKAWPLLVTAKTRQTVCRHASDCWSSRSMVSEGHMAKNIPGVQSLALWISPRG